MELFLQFKNIWFIFGVILQSALITVILEGKLKSFLKFKTTPSPQLLQT